MSSQKNAPIMLTFIDVGEPTPLQKRKNQSLAKSHVMKVVRKEQRLERKRQQSELLSKSSDPSSLKNGDEKDQALNSIRSTGFVDTHVLKYSQALDRLLQPAEPILPGIVWSLSLQRNISSIALSRSSFVECELNVLHSCSGRVTLHLHELIDHVVQYVWGKFWPGRVAGEASPLAREWWPLFCNNPAVFHAFIFAAAVHYDDLHVTTNLSQTRELLIHKHEALRHLRTALIDLNGEVPNDAIVLAMTYLGIGSWRDDGCSRMDREESPFNPPSPVDSIQWKRHYAYPKDNVHTNAAKRLVEMKGGLDSLPFILAKSNWINELHVAAANLRKPQFPNWDIPVIQQDAANPRINAIPSDISQRHTNGFIPLLNLGLTKEAHQVLTDVNDISFRVELYCNNQLTNPDLMVLLSKKNAVHHALLSLPPATALGLPESQHSMYECCRVGGLLYSSAVLFPLPPSTGILRRLVDAAKGAVETVKLETCFTGGVRMLIWVLLLMGVAAKGSLERVWVLRRLKQVLVMEGIKTWEGLKDVVGRFLWMDAACDGGAREVWEELRHPPYL